MKILVMSLLRLGDVVLATPILKGLKEKNKGVLLHLLINAQFENIAPLVPYVDKIIFFDREILQKSLSDKNRPLFEPYDRLNFFLEELNNQDYDEVINLTHNKLSGWLLSLIRAKYKRGITIQSNGTLTFGSPWFRYLNDYITSGRRDIYHYIDIFFYGTGLKDQVHNITLKESDSGRAEVDAIVQTKEPFIVVQPLTSEAKKNWGLDKFSKALEFFSKLHRHVRIFILGASSEKESLESLMQKLHRAEVNAELIICKLETAYSLLKRAQILLTGDTSIKHLACAAGTKIVELSLGSSFYQKTGAYLEGSIIIQGKEACAPCPHSTPCLYNEHKCAEKMSPEVVALVCSKILLGQHDDLRLIAHEFSEEVEILRTTFTDTGDWTAYPLAESFTDTAVARWIDRSSWKILLNDEHKQIVASYGSESLMILKLLKNIFPDQSAQEWRSTLENIERYVEKLEVSLGQLLLDMRRILKKFNGDIRADELYEQVSVFSARIKTSELSGSYYAVLGKVMQSIEGPEFVRVRCLQESVTDLHRRAKIELKLVRSLKLQMTEVI